MWVHAGTRVLRFFHYILTPHNDKVCEPGETCVARPRLPRVHQCFLSRQSLSLSSASLGLGPVTLLASRWLALQRPDVRSAITAGRGPSHDHVPQ